MFPPAKLSGRLESRSVRGGPRRAPWAVRFGSSERADCAPSLIAASSRFPQSGCAIQYRRRCDTTGIYGLAGVRRLPKGAGDPGRQSRGSWRLGVRCGPRDCRRELKRPTSVQSRGVVKPLSTHTAESHERDLMTRQERKRNRNLFELRRLVQAGAWLGRSE